MKYIPTFTFLYLTICLVFFACNYTQKITDGTTAFQQKQYAVAAPMFEKEYKRTKDGKERAELAFLAGESYHKLNQNEKALIWYKKAHDGRYGDKATHQYAFALKKAEIYLEAIDIFRELEAESTRQYNYRKEIQACKNAMTWNQQKEDNLYKVKAVDFNSPQADYSPTLYENGYLVFSSDRPQSTGKDSYKWTGNAFSDLYMVNPKNGQTSLLPTTINTEYNEGTVTFNADFTQMIFSRCGTNGELDDYCKLMESRKEGDNWTSPKVLSFVMNQVNYTQACWNPDYKTLYFVADLKDGWGGFDIYKVTYSKSGWGEPQILSAIINTEEDDMFPSFDGDTLYFASEGRGGMGGLDIYKTYQTQPNKWIKPINLEAPINSGEDDFGLIVSEHTNNEWLQKGYFSSARKDGKGNDDIYAFSKMKPAPIPVEPAVVIDTPEVEIPEPIIEKDILLTVNIFGKTYAKPNDPKSTITGKKPIANAGLQINATALNNRVKTDINGQYQFKIEKEIDYRFFVSSDEYYNKSVMFNTINLEEDTLYTIDIILDKIFKNVEIKLDNIYYDYNKWEIREDAKPTLNKLSRILLQNPDIKIILGSHTDCRGKEAYNQSLSQKRAQSAVDYLVSLGIATDRLQATGYGEAVPADNCKCNSCNDDQHQANRRTTFQIID